VEKILSQDEINELLAAIRNGDIDIESESQGGSSDSDKSFAKLDLFKGQSSARWRIANFDIILDSFARNYGISMANRLKRSVSVQRVAIETEVFESFLQNLQEHGLIGVMRFEPLRSGGLLIYDSPLAFCLMEVLLGGSSESGITIPDRGLTSIEINVLQNVMDDACRDWEKAFEPLEDLETSIVKAETNPRMVNIVSPETEVLVARFSVKAGNLFGQMSIVVPYFALEPYKEKLKNRMLNVISLSGMQTWTSQLKEELMELEMEVAAQFATASLTMREILSLRTGDVIELDTNASDSQQLLKVEDKTKFTAVAGIQEGKKAVRIAGRAYQGEEDEQRQQ
jgi:flagellar motor switch protein FliM